MIISFPFLLQPHWDLQVKQKRKRDGRNSFLKPSSSSSTLSFDNLSVRACSSSSGEQCGCCTVRPEVPQRPTLLSRAAFPPNRCQTLPRTPEQTKRKVVTVTAFFYDKTLSTGQRA